LEQRSIQNAKCKVQSEKCKIRERIKRYSFLDFRPEFDF